MERRVLLLSAIAMLAGCQSQNPFAAFGPPTVPSPTTSQSAPYYPPTATASNRGTASSVAPSTRISVSAEGTTPPPAPRTTVVADADRETIRIVENPAAQTRTASAATRNSTSGATPPTLPPPALQPVPVNPLPNGKPPASPQSKFVPSPPSPASAPRPFRADSAVAPASFQQPVPAFSETPMASGQWRAR